MTPRVSRIPAGLVVLLAAAPLHAQGPARTAVESSYTEARQVLEAGLQAAGGAGALQAVKDISRKGSGKAFNQGQSARVDPPYTTRDIETTSVVDFANRRSATETTSAFAGNIPTRGRVVLAGDSGFTVNLVSNVMTPAGAAAVAGQRTALRRDPAALLLTANSRAETLRSLGEGAFDGRPHRVITFADADGTQIALYLDAKTNVLSKSETFGDNPVLGDTVSEVVYSDYRTVGGIPIPHRVVNRTGGEVVQDVAFSEVRVNTAPDAAAFAAPTGGITGTPTGPATTVSVKPLGDGVYLLEGSSHNSLAVAFQDHVVVVEGPQSEERTQAVLAKLKETVPGKPIKTLVMTHHHYDHTGGLRGYIANGTTILTTAGNKALVERIASARHTVRPDALSRAPRPAVVETFAKKRVLTDGVHTLELHDVGPNPHVHEVVVAYLPKEKILFQADLVGTPAVGPLPPASPATEDLLPKVKALGLQVDTIVGAHGRTATLDEIGKTLAAQKSN